MNPLLSKFDTPFGTVPFDIIKDEHFLPAIKDAIKMAKEEIDIIKNDCSPSTYENTIEALEDTGFYLGQASSVFYNLNSSETNENIQNAAKEISPMLSSYSNDIILDKALFAKVKEVHDKKDTLNLSVEQMTLLEKKYKNFVRNGAMLSEEEKEELRDIDAKLSKASVKFAENSLAANNEFVIFVDSEEELSGLPDSAKEAAASTAKEKGQDGKWAFTFDYPSYLPLVTYAENRALREKIVRAFSKRCFSGDKNDNSELVKEISSLRYKRAKLLGYDSHSNFVLEERMAGKPETVIGFLDDILEKAMPFAKDELKRLNDFAKSIGGPEKLEKWDTSFYSEKLKKELFDIDDELLRPYFKIENAVDGVFAVATKLFGITFRPLDNIQTYHKDVKVFEVLDEKNNHVGVFYCDFFPRAGKRGGAWQTSFRSQKMTTEGDQRPHVVIVCNFTKPTETKPSLLSFMEVTTLFHEFGHALHNLLTKCQYESTSGTSVFWDFVELPSQIMENWAFEKECLDLFAVHYETGEKIPAELIKKIKESSNFQEGMASARQVSLGLIDMGWHSIDPTNVIDVDKHENESAAKSFLTEPIPGSSVSCSFGHIFSGGYSSGYYSYKWAEVLDADAFEMFKDKGIFNKEVSTLFMDNVLSRGGTEHPMELYKKFRGKEPSVDALLKRGGLIK